MRNVSALRSYALHPGNATYYEVHGELYLYLPGLRYTIGHIPAARLTELVSDYMDDIDTDREPLFCRTYNPATQKPLLIFTDRNGNHFMYAGIF